MPRPFIAITAVCAITTAALVGACTSSRAPQTVTRTSRYEELIALFTDWRAFQQPRLVNGVPDYTANTMAAQQRELPAYQRRLAAIDPGGWPVNQQVDWHSVRAEMNGLDFDHRVRKPWATNPAFYVTVFPNRSDQPAREGPFAHGAVETWSHAFPLAPDKAGQMAAGIRTVPGLLEQARTNLVGNARDLWVFGTRSIRRQSTDLAQLASRVGDATGSLQADIQRAKDATDAFAAWLDAQASSRNGPSGVGAENYDQSLRSVVGSRSPVAAAVPAAAHKDRRE